VCFYSLNAGSFGILSSGSNFFGGSVHVQDLGRFLGLEADVHLEQLQFVLGLVESLLGVHDVVNLLEPLGWGVAAVHLPQLGIQPDCLLPNLLLQADQILGLLEDALCRFKVDAVLGQLTDVEACAQFRLDVGGVAHGGQDSGFGEAVRDDPDGDDGILHDDDVFVGVYSGNAGNSGILPQQ